MHVFFFHCIPVLPVLCGTLVLLANRWNFLLKTRSADDIYLPF